MSNPARIARLPYTLNRKSGRRASVLEYPRGAAPTPAGKIYHLALEGGYKTDYGAPRASTSGTLAIDALGVRKLVEEFPDHLHLDRVTQQGEITYFSLAACPFTGRAHRGQNIGAGKTTILLRPDSIGFKCFSDDCADHTFTALLRLLHQQTGRWPSMPIWEDDFNALDARWGGIDDVSIDDRAEQYVRACFEDGHWDCIGQADIESCLEKGYWSVLAPGHSRTTMERRYVNA